MVGLSVMSVSWTWWMYNILDVLSTIWFTPADFLLRIPDLPNGGFIYHGRKLGKK